MERRWEAAKLRDLDELVSNSPQKLDRFSRPDLAVKAGKVERRSPQVSLETHLYFGSYVVRSKSAEKQREEEIVAAQA